jgi:hypothetical protein
MVHGDGDGDGDGDDEEMKQPNGTAEEDDLANGKHTHTH